MWRLLETADLDAAWVRDDDQQAVSASPKICLMKLLCGIGQCCSRETEGIWAST